MSPRRLLRAPAEHRRERHQDPYTTTEMASSRCRLQRLIQASSS